MTLLDFRLFICCDQYVENAEILSTELYSKWTGRVTHQFVLLELYREGRPTVWLKLERTLAYFRHAVAHFGFAPASDKAVLGVEKKALIRNAKRENRQEFRNPPKLAKLSLILESIWLESMRYIFWSENCYFFCSALQQRLGAEHGGAYVHGHLRFAFLATYTRRQIEHQVRSLYRMRYGHPLTELLQAAITTRDKPAAKLVVDIPRCLETFDRTDLVGRTVLIYQLCEAVYEVGKAFHAVNRIGDALVLHEATNDFLLRLSDWSERQFHEVADSRRRFYEHFTWMFGRLLRKSMHVDRSCATAAQDVSLARWLFAKDPESHRDDLATSLQNYGKSLREAGRLREACDASAEEVTLLRLPSARSLEAHRRELSIALYNHGISLRHAGRLNEACDAGAEDVALVRLLHAGNPQRYRRNLSSSLFKYSLSLRDAGRLAEACDAGAEELSIMRLLKSSNPEAYHVDLSYSLRNYGISLRKAGRSAEASNAGAEDVSLMRSRTESTLDGYHLELSNALHFYAQSLQEEERFDEACEAFAEDVALRRALSAGNRHRSRWLLAQSLCKFATALRKAERYGEACNAGAEAVSLVRPLYALNPAVWQFNLVECLDSYFDSLWDAGRKEDAEKIWAEGDKLWSGEAIAHR